jgi:hypothetical protein
MTKLYANDPDIPYRTTKIKNPMRTKADIDGILARWGITKVAWDFDLDSNHVELRFQLNEKFHGRTIEPVIKLEPPRIWNKRKKKQEESVNWAVSLRVLFWYIKNTLAMTYAMQSQIAVAFLPHIRIVPETGPETTVKDIVIPKLNEIKNLKALPEIKPGEIDPEKVIEVS